MLKFTIVITTCNRLSFLKRAIQSALEQSYPCEVIVVDDCSSDDTKVYLKSLENQIVYLRNSQNLGHSKSVNLGVEHAQGDWIKLLDDDDYLASNCIEQIANAITNSPQAVICSCQAIQVDQQGTELKRTSFVGSQNVQTIRQEDIHYLMLMEMLPFGTPVQVAFQKQAFQKSNGWNPAFDSNYDDIYCWIKISEYGDAVLINEYLTYRTIWTGGTAYQLSLEARLKKNMEIKQIIYELINPKYKEVIPSLSTINSFLKLYWGLVGIRERKVAEGLKIIGWSWLSIGSLLYLIKLIYLRKFKRLVGNIH